jgi:hypothetical protein
MMILMIDSVCLVAYPTQTKGSYVHLYQILMIKEIPVRLYSEQMTDSKLKVLVLIRIQTRTHSQYFGMSIVTVDIRYF